MHSISESWPSLIRVSRNREPAVLWVQREPSIPRHKHLAQSYLQSPSVPRPLNTGRCRSQPRRPSTSSTRLAWLQSRRKIRSCSIQLHSQLCTGFFRGRFRVAQSRCLLDTHCACLCSTDLEKRSFLWLANLRIQTNQNNLLTLAYPGSIYILLCGSAQV